MVSMLRVALAVILLWVSPFVHAGLLGHSVGLTFETEQIWFGPNPPPPLITADFGLATVGSGIEFPNALNWIIDVSDTSIHFSLGDTLGDWITENKNGFLGFRLHDADGSLPAIVGVSIGLDAYVGLDPTQISFDSDDILIDMKMYIDGGFRLEPSGGCENAPPEPPGLGICAGNWIVIRAFRPEFVLNIEFASAAIPEPGSALLMFTGLLVLARRRKITQP